eukprot:TRINITY_DN1771_c0_g1_i1.p1 TRINITY_DN1771_c0_g1~~TRINITY_DN1771_c0_g1_i1.p1  ORF type:complete len:483 (+),score=72.13 TRINITY_DN1771_c0_g1_i1:27-1475(+)
MEVFSLSESPESFIGMDEDILLADGLVADGDAFAIDEIPFESDLLFPEPQESLPPAQLFQAPSFPAPEVQPVQPTHTPRARAPHPASSLTPVAQSAPVTVAFPVMPVPAAKPAFPTIDPNMDPVAAAKKQRRLLRNRESALQFRLRRQALIDGLQAQVKELGERLAATQQENTLLRQKLQEAGIHVDISPPVSEHSVPVSAPTTSPGYATPSPSSTYPHPQATAPAMPRANSRKRAASTAFATILFAFAVVFSVPGAPAFLPPASPHALTISHAGARVLTSYDPSGWNALLPPSAGSGMDGSLVVRGDPPNYQPFPELSDGRESMQLQTRLVLDALKLGHPRPNSPVFEPAPSSYVVCVDAYRLLLDAAEAAAQRGPTVQANVDATHIEDNEDSETEEGQDVEPIRPFGVPRTSTSESSQRSPGATSRPDDIVSFLISTASFNATAAPVAATATDEQGHPLMLELTCQILGIRFVPAVNVTL